MGARGRATSRAKSRARADAARRAPALHHHTLWDLLLFLPPSKTPLGAAFHAHLYTLECEHDSHSPYHPPSDEDDGDSGDGGDGSDSGDDDDAKYAKRLAHLMKTDPEFAPPAYVGVSVPRGERARGSCCDCKE